MADVPENKRGRHAAFQPREQGKFAPGKPEVPIENQQDTSKNALLNDVNGQKNALLPDRPPMVKSLKKELEPHWNAAHPELAKAWVEREAAIERFHNESKTKLTQADELLNEFRPYEWILRNENATPAMAIRDLMKTGAILRTGTPEQKAHHIALAIRQFGVQPDMVGQFLQGQIPAATGAQADPAYNQLAQQVQQLTQQITQSQQSRSVSAIQQFAADPANVHFERLQPDIIDILQSPNLATKAGITDGMSEMEKLTKAYQPALRYDPDLSQQVVAQQQEAQRKQADEAAMKAKQTAVQVRGAPGAALPVSVDPKDRREVIRNALRGLH
jgi:DNA repair exonuclease SbcCD ATPase subunit